MLKKKSIQKITGLLLASILVLTVVLVRPAQVEASYYSMVIIKSDYSVSGDSFAKTDTYPVMTNGTTIGTTFSVIAYISLYNGTIVSDRAVFTAADTVSYRIMTYNRTIATGTKLYEYAQLVGGNAASRTFYYSLSV